MKGLPSVSARGAELCLGGDQTRSDGTAMHECSSDVGTTVPLCSAAEKHSFPVPMLSL